MLLTCWQGGEVISGQQRDAQKAIHIRVSGEPGIGKTRFVLEALRDEDLAPLVVYCDTSQAVTTVLLSHLRRADKDAQILLVVDECDRTSTMEFWRLLEDSGPRIKLITIYSEADEDVGGETKQVEIEALDDVQIANIIKIYGAFPEDQVNRWVPYCSGSPRVADVVGQNLAANPDDLLKSPDTVPVWERFIAGKNTHKQTYEERKEVLIWLSLFKKFGYEKPNEKEFELLARKIQNRTGIPSAKIHTIIHDMRERKILQGRTTLYVTPKLLHIKLWTWWWKKYGSSVDARIVDFVVIDGSTDPPAVLSHDLISWYSEMFRYAKESEEASKVVKALLGQDGAFQNIDFFVTGIGSRLFGALAEANPEAALHVLQRLVGKLPKEQLLQFHEGRRVVVNALQEIAMEKDLFQDAARLLLVLGEAENEEWANNASGIFAAMFSSGYGTVAPSAAPPELRFPVLKEAMESNSKKRRMLALKACNAALETFHWMGMARSADQGTRKEPDLWMPKTWEEWFDSLRRVWMFLYEKVEQLPDEESKEAIRILLDRSRGVARIENLSLMVLDTIEALAKKSYVSRKDLLDAVLTVLRFEKENITPESLVRWESLKEELTGRDYPSKMKRYVGIAFMHDMTSEGDPLDPVAPRIMELAKESVLHTDSFVKELSWLTTNKAENGYLFGYNLAENDPGYSLLDILLDAQRQAGTDGSAFFLGGYFRHMAEKKSLQYEEELDKMAADPLLKKWIPEITWRAMTTDKAAQRLIDLIKRGEIDRKSLHIFALGGAVRNLDEKIFVEWIGFLLSHPEDFDSIALAANLYHFYYLNSRTKRELPDELTKRILMDDAFFGIIGGRKAEEVLDMPAFGNTMVEYYWTELAKAYVSKYPDKSLELGYKMLEHFGEDWSVVSRYSDGKKVLTEIARINTLKMWEQVSRFLGPPIDARAYHIEQWLHGDHYRDEEKGFLTNIPLQRILDWVNENVEERAWYLAQFVPKKPFAVDGKICPREVLIHYGDREDVRRNLRANFETEFFSGSESLHEREKKEYLLKLKVNENNPNVRLWIDEYVESLDEHIKRAENEEERRGF